MAAKVQEASFTDKLDGLSTSEDIVLDEDSDDTCELERIRSRTNFLEKNVKFDEYAQVSNQLIGA